MKLTDKIPSATQRVLVYGAPKTGKTELVAKLAASYNLLWFDLENGYSTLLKLPREQQERIRVISIPDSRIFPIAVETCLKVVRGGVSKICDAHGKVSCPLCTKDGAPVEEINFDAIPLDTIVVFDSLTQFSNSAIANITKTQPDDYKMDFDDWGHLKGIVEKFLSQIQQAKYNVVCITHEEEVEFEDKKKKIVPVCGSSKSSRNTAKYFDHVVYCEVKNRKHGAASSTTFMNNILTGSRTDAQLEKNTDGNPTLFDIFKGGMTAAPTQGQVALNALKGMVAGK